MVQILELPWYVAYVPLVKYRVHVSVWSSCAAAWQLHIPQPAKLAVFGGVAAQSQLLRQQLEVLLCESSTYGKAHEIAIREIQAVHHHIRDCAEQAAKHDARQSTLQALEQFVQTNSALRALHLGQVLAACS